MTDLQEAFYNFDLDQDGFISLEDIRLIVTTDGEPIPDVSESPPKKTKTTNSTFFFPSVSVAVD